MPTPITTRTSSRWFQPNSQEIQVNRHTSPHNTTQMYYKVSGPPSRKLLHPEGATLRVISSGHRKAGLLASFGGIGLFAIKFSSVLRDFQPSRHSLFGRTDYARLQRTPDLCRW